MNYRHGYHAGNFCDVFKHLVLLRLIEHFKLKEKGFTVLDAHAGDGSYSLRGERAAQTREAENGILRALAFPHPAASLSSYLNLVRRLGLPDADGRLTCYPGSPRLTRALLRPQDRLELGDIHAQALQSLQRLFKDDRQVHIHNMDAGLALKSLLPPPSRRGLILLDPPFESPDEFRNLLAAFKEGCQRFSTGTYAIWYPLKDREPVRHFHRQLAASGMRPVLTAEISVAPLGRMQLNGCGMAIVNPPWKLDEELRSLLPELLAALGAENTREILVEWMAPK